MIEEFKKYVNNYDLDNKDIFDKYNHSLRVFEICRKYAKLMNLSDEDIELCELIGLLHDFGRFKQLEVYNTYEDHLSIDHADYSVEVLFGEKMYIKNFWKNENDYELIKFAIKNHNKKNIEPSLNERHLFFAKFIRDADKLDIIRTYSSDCFKNITTDKISPNVEREIQNGKTVSSENVKNINDSYCRMFAFIYDVNFNEFEVEIKDIIYSVLDKLNCKFDNVVKELKENIERKQNVRSKI